MLKGYRTKFKTLERIKEGQEVGNTVKVMLQEESGEDSVTCALPMDPLHHPS